MDKIPSEIVEKWISHMKDNYPGLLSYRSRYLLEGGNGTQLFSVEIHGLEANNHLLSYPLVNKLNEEGFYNLNQIYVGDFVGALYV